MTDFAKMNSSLQVALKKIGTEGEHKCPSSQDPLDQVLHDYYVAKTGEKFFKDRASKTLDSLTSKLGDDAKKTIQNIINATIKNEAGESAVVAGGAHYVLDFATRKGAKRLDVVALSNKLQVKYGLPAAAVEKLLDECSKASEPSKIYSVKPVRDQ